MDEKLQIVTVDWFCADGTSDAICRFDMSPLSRIGLTRQPHLTNMKHRYVDVRLFHASLCK